VKFAGGRAEAERFVRARRLYGKFHPDVLEAFLEHGIKTNDEDDDGGDGKTASFVFTPEQEAEFYLTTPSDLFSNGDQSSSSSSSWSVGQYGEARCHGTYLYSTRHEVNTALDLRYLLNSAKGLRGPGGHPFTSCGLDVPHFHPLIDLDHTAALVMEHAKAAFA
jgi:hypothetical protein